MCSGYCLELLPSLKTPLSRCWPLIANRRTFYSGVWLVLVWGSSAQRAPWCSGLSFDCRVGAQVWYPGTSWLRGLVHLCQKELYFQTPFLDGLLDLPTSIYWCNSVAEEAGSWPDLLVLMGARELFHRMTARTPSPCQIVFLLRAEPTAFLCILCGQ